MFQRAKVSTNVVTGTDFWRQNFTNLKLIFFGRAPFRETARNAISTDLSSFFVVVVEIKQMWVF
jgi:hypothetical protein